MFQKITRLIRHTLIYGLGNSGSRLVGFLLLPLYTYYLRPEDYGVLALVSVFTQILFTVTSLGQGTAVFRRYFTHEDPAERDAVLTTALWLLLMLSFPIGLGVLAFSRPLSILLTGSAEYTGWVMLGIGAVLFKVLLRLPLAALRAREESWRYAASSLAQTSASLVLAVVFVAGLHLGGAGVLLSQLLAEALVAVYLLPLVFYGLRLRFAKEDARDMLGYTAYGMPSSVFGFLLHMSDRFFLKHYATLHAVGLYALGYRFGEILAFGMWAFKLAWQPFVFENRKGEDAPVLYARVCTYVAAILGFAWLVVSLLAPEVIAIIARPSYLEAHRIVPWIAAAFVFQGFAQVTNTGIVLHRKVRYRPVIVGTAAAVNLGLNFVLVPRFGMMGAAVSSCASFFVWFVLQAYVGNRLYPVPYEYGRALRALGVSVALYAVGSFIAGGSLLATLGGKSLLILAWPLCLYATGFFGPGELARLRRVLEVARSRRRALPEAPEAPGAGE